MNRIIAAAVAFTFVTAVGVHAQEPQAPSNSGVPATAQFSHVFDKASIEKAVAANKAMSPLKTIAAARTPAPLAPRAGKNFFKTPWPYIIGGAIAAGIIIAVNSGSSSSTGNGY